MPLHKLVILIVLLGLAAIATWFVASFLIRLRWPAKIPRQFAFEHELTTEKKLREVAELLVPVFQGPAPGNVVCLGPARGSAARLLFHAGPNNRGRNRSIYRPDYVLHVKRVRGKRVSLVLDTNRPYSYFRVRQSEIVPLVEALQRSFGGITSL
jgi:hypothetical protein